jgi:hypothetical protein
MLHISILQNGNDTLLLVNDGMTAHHIHADEVDLGKLRDVLDNHLSKESIIPEGHYGENYVCQNCRHVQLIPIRKGSRPFDVLTDLRKCSRCEINATFVKYGISTR